MTKARQSHPAISVIVPVYNAEKFLEQCIESILAQTFKNFELIIVDDGSTDTSAQLCDAFAAKNSNIVILHQPNGGQSKARKAGLKKATADYVILVDADDWLEPHALETLYKHAIENNADIVTCDSTFHTNGRKTPVRQQVPKGVFNQDGLKQQIYPVMLYSGTFFYFGIFAAMWNKLFRKSLLLPNIMHIDNRIRIGEDGLATYGAFLDAKKVCIIDDLLYNYRNDNVSITRSYAEGQFDGAQLLINSLRQISKEKGIIDLTEQINYYYIYNVRSIFEEEFLYKTQRSLKQKWNYLQSVATHPSLQQSVKDLVPTNMNTWNRLFLSLLKSRQVELLFAATLLYINLKKARSKVLQH